jgi:hypothetical protein
MRATAKFYQRFLVILFLMMLPLIAGNRQVLAENNYPRLFYMFTDTMSAKQPWRGWKG